MSPKKTLEAQIEQLRLKMYDASKIKNNYDQVVNISQELDKLLNKLEQMGKKVDNTK